VVDGEFNIGFLKADAMRGMIAKTNLNIAEILCQARSETISEYRWRLLVFLETFLRALLRFSTGSDSVGKGKRANSTSQ
jgi:hypothetical protein